MINATKAAQIFSVSGQFKPTKTSVYLLTNLFDNRSYFDVSSQTVIDSGNFASLTDNTQRIFHTDVETGYSGAGYLIYPSSVYSSIISEDFNMVEYPIKNSGNNNVYVRLRDPDGIGSCDIEVYIDDTLESTTNIVFVGTGWEWHSLGVINLTNDNVYDLGIRLYTNGVAFDQIAINPVLVPAGSSALTLTTAPYITAHMGVYSIDESLTPTLPLYIHDYKTSIGELRQDGWYNFDLNFINSSIDNDFLDSYALYFSVSGANNKNFITWERNDADEYSFEPSAYNE